VEAILVSGANGLLGRAVCKKLVEMRHDVLGIVRGSVREPIPGVDYIELDFVSDWSIACLPERVDRVIHLAQSSHYREFPIKALDVFRVNVDSTARLLDYSRGCGARQFIFASSGGVYGNGSNAFDEASPMVPIGQLGYYLGSKACGEILAQSYTSVFQVTIIRPFFMYGPGQNRGMLIPRLIDSVLNHKPVDLQGESGIRINPVHVCDASEAVCGSMKHTQSALFNIAGGEVLSIRDICCEIGAKFGTVPVFRFMPGEPKDLIGDITAMKTLLHIPTRRFVDSLNEITPLPGGNQ
jgi:nucleoside-diphosphate-sugar epimerase